ncbi:MAG TPA: PRC-barrel domain-containing protein [Verrucomicrobiae bacterium]|nr:PRC-barrel domain-containing protein [Verrucomicrobiae bacterium]
MLVIVRKTWWVVCLCFSLHQSVAGETTSSTNLPPLQRLNSVLRMSVETRDGQNVGSVRNIVLDVDRGIVGCVLVGPDGLLKGRKVRPVPPHLISTSTAKRGVAGLNIMPRDWNSAPVINASALNTPATAATLADLPRRFDAISKPSEGSQPAMQTLAATGRPAKSPPQGRLMLVTDLIGESVYGTDQNKLGEVIDVLAALDGEKSCFLLLSPGKRFKSNEHAYAIPLGRIAIDESGRLQLDAEPAQLSSARHFDPTVWRTGGVRKNEILQYPRTN